MPVNTESITLDVSKAPLITPTLYLGQYDANGTTLTAEIYDNGTPINLDNYGVRFCMRLPNEISYYSVDGTASGNVATINIDETFAATVPGFTDVAYIEVFSGETVICSTNRINVIVLENAKEGADPSQSHSPAIDEAIEAANSAALAANNAAVDASTAAGSANESEDNASDAAQAANEAAENATTAAANANTAADSANTATINANNAAQSASASATAADTAAESANDASQRAEAAIEAIGDISELAVPLMSSTTRGGATLGSGLIVDGGALSIGDIVTDETNGPIYSVDAKGWAEQETTTGKNLLDESLFGSLNNTLKPIQIALPDGTYTASSTCPLDANAANILIGAGYLTSYSGMTTANSGVYSGKSRTLQPADGYITMFCRKNDAYDLHDYQTQLEAGSTATEYEPYTGGAPSPSPDNPQEVRVARGRNLTQTNTVAPSTSSIALVDFGGDRTFDALTISFLADALNISGSTGTALLDFQEHDGTHHYVNNSTIGMAAGVNDGRKSHTLSDVTCSKVVLLARSDMYGKYTAGTFREIQLELGTTPTPYVPYGHVGLEVRDSSDELVSVTPIPLPAKGFAASLPDGTADVLAIDSAGRCEWESVTTVRTLNGDSSEVWGNYDAFHGFLALGFLPASMNRAYGFCSITPVVQAPLSADTLQCWLGVNTPILYLCGVQTALSITTVSDWRAWLAANPVTVIHKLATPTTEHGYIDLPTIPEGATVDIPELREVGVKCFVPGVSELVDHANNWGERCKQNESRIAALEAAIANLATS